MQEFVFFITGKVKKPLTIDPSVWIFDERKIDLKKVSMRRCSHLKNLI